MHNYKLITLILLGLILLVPTLTRSQSTVAYDFKNNSFDKEIPFDELITFKFINIPDKTKEIILRIQQVSGKKIKLKGSSKPYDSDSAIINSNIRPIELKIDSLSINNENLTAFKLCPIYFPPNNDYIFTITTIIKQRPLTDKEENILFDTLIKSGLITNQLQNFTEAAIAKGFGSISTSANITLDSIRKIADNTVLSLFGPNAVNKFDQKAIESETSKMTAFAVNILNLVNKIGDYKNNLNVLIKQRKNVKNEKINTADSLFAVRKIESIYSALQAVPFFAPDGFAAVNEQIDSFVSYLDNAFISSDDVKQLKIYSDSLRIITSNFIQSFIQDVVLNQVIVREFGMTTYPKGLVEQSKNYIAADIGSAYVGPLDKFVFFSCATIYFRPVKRSVPLKRYQGWDILRSRLSADIGITLTSISVPNEIQGFAFQEQADSDKGLILGLGCRILPFLKIDGGTMVYRADDPNPLVNDLAYKWSWYIGASIDLEVSALFKASFSGTKSNKTE
jgi:hypothetical protein